MGALTAMFCDEPLDQCNTLPRTDLIIVAAEFDAEGHDVLGVGPAPLPDNPLQEKVFRLIRKLQGKDHLGSGANAVGQALPA